MKRKFMCLLLAAVMALSCFAAIGCSPAEDETVEGGTTDDTALGTVTLTLWIPTYEDTTEEAILAVQEALNKVTKARYETAIELHAIPYDEYEAAVDARLTEIEEIKAFEKAEAERKRKEAKEAAKNGGTTTAETTAEIEETSPEEDTYVNDIGMTVLRYPEVEEDQMDIFLIRGYENYQSYVEREALLALDSELSGTSKLLKQYIYPTFLTYAKVNGSTYAIPNNHVIGEYKYLLINKRLVEELYWDIDDLTTLIRCEDFILDVKNFTDVTPLLAEADAVGMNYWSADGEWSLLATQLPNGVLYETYCPPRNLFMVKNYTDTVKLMKLLEESECIAEDPSSVEEFGVAILSGDASLPEQYEDEYYVSIYESPTATTDDIYSSMFGVSAYTKSLSRSMEILVALNTDTELRTILQYGAEDTHWKVNDEDESIIDIISDDYHMNLLDTGNVYMTYPGEGIPMSYWEYAKKQNLDSKESPFIGFRHEDYYTEENAADFEELAAASADFLARIEAMSYEEFSDSVSSLRSEINDLEIVIKMLDDSSETSPIALYDDFHNMK